MGSARCCGSDLVCASSDKMALPDFKQRINPHNVHEVFTVAVTADLAVIEAREIKRKDRANGLARSQYDIVHHEGQYDLLVDTTKQKPKAAAAEIAKHFS